MKMLINEFTMRITKRNELKTILPLDFVAAEIGIAEGRFSKELLDMGCKRLYCVDAWQNLPQTGDGGFAQEWHDNNEKQFDENVFYQEQYRGKIHKLKGLSVQMANRVQDGTLDLVYLDADHSYRGVMDDLMAWC